MEEFRTGSIEANGLRFHFLEQGEGPLILCLHGFPDHARSFRHQLRALSAHGYRVVAPNMRGYVPSEIPADGSYQLAVLGQDAVSLIDALGYESAVVFGYDFAAGATYAAALIAPEKISKLITASGPYGAAVGQSYVTNFEQLKRSWHIFFFLTPFAEAAVSFNDYAFIEKLWQLWSPGWHYPAEEMEALKTTFRQPGVLQAALDYYRCLFDEKRSIATLQHIQEQYGKASIQVPTLYLHGERDGSVLAELSEGMEAYFPNGLQKVMVPNAGHFLHQEKPDEVNRVILEFLATEENKKKENGSMALTERISSHRERASASTSAPPDVSSELYPPELIQRLVDQAAFFNVFVGPNPQRYNPAICLSGDANSIIGFRGNESLHRFEIDMQLPSLTEGVKAKNIIGQPVGKLDLRWMIIPYGYPARPDREPPQTVLDPSRSQRFAMQEGTFTFGDGRDGFRSFGTGRIFPMMVGRQPKLVATAVGNITEGFGKFSDHEGNFVFCGEILPEQGFLGHIAIRVQDPNGALRTQEPLPPLEASPVPDPEATFLAWVGQKGKGADQENRFSFTPDGQPRGLNISTELKRAWVRLTDQGPLGIRSSDLQTGVIFGKEIGFGPLSSPGVPTTGTALRPFLFGGVARYSLFDEDGRTVGAITTNILEGRRFDMELAGAPGEPAFRFGFFGPIMYGSGCFHGVEGIFYGVSGSVLRPPPGGHVVTHFYVVRLNDPEGRFRAPVTFSEGF
jgi:pimeloyl-ACP methyl ester carboxylesterase